jgi:hypothetical protein
MRGPKPVPFKADLTRTSVLNCSKLTLAVAAICIEMAHKRSLKGETAEMRRQENCA